MSNNIEDIKSSLFRTINHVASEAPQMLDEIVTNTVLIWIIQEFDDKMKELIGILSKLENSMLYAFGERFDYCVNLYCYYCGELRWLYYRYLLFEELVQSRKIQIKMQTDLQLVEEIIAKPKDQLERKLMGLKKNHGKRYVLEQEN